MNHKQIKSESKNLGRKSTIETRLLNRNSGPMYVLYVDRMVDIPVRMAMAFKDRDMAAIHHGFLLVTSFFRGLSRKRWDFSVSIKVLALALQ